MGVLYTMERHHELLHLWRRQEAAALRVVHLDFHCDMRGMLVDRKEQRAYRIRDRFPVLDQGNFLAHAVMESRVAAVLWVHDDPGGRRDDIGTVKFESDLSALPHRVGRVLRRQNGIPLDYDVTRSAEWEGLREGERLDIDWDYFASLEYPIDSIPARIERFWQSQSEVIPEEASICYSPEYSHPTRELFAEFVTDLASRFGLTIVELEPPTGQLDSTQGGIRNYVPARLHELARSAYRRSLKALKYRGIY